MSDEAKGKHTPGPWRVEARHMEIVGHVYAVMDGDNFPPAFVPAWEDDAPQEAEANAHLIAAAPDLLAALKECADELEEWVAHHYGDDIHPALERKVHRDMEPVRIARLAIAKAEGGPR